MKKVRRYSIRAILFPRLFQAQYLSYTDQNSQTAYFRGRKLRGRRVAVPEGYEGVVATPTERTIRPAQNNSVDEAEPEEPVKILEKQATFQDVMVWGHELMPAADDPFVKGVEEWVRFAEAVSSFFLPA